MRKKTVYLDTLDGFEFEKLCETIFSTLKYGRVERTPCVGDKGIDLIIYTDYGKIIVECKHLQRGTIGRPVIQKLHSAVISEGAIKGIIVTTGVFSKQALSHAKSLVPPIELIDRGGLCALASMAGIELVTGSKRGTVYTFCITNNQQLKSNLAEYLHRFLISVPKRIDELIQISKRSIYLRPVYSVSYSVSAVFSTTVGVIHSENDMGILFIDGISGNILDENISKSFIRTPAEVLDMEKHSGVEIGVDVYIIPFKFPAGSVKETAIDYIINKHTRRVSYRGSTSRVYTKVCVPRRNDIYISDISQIYLPENDVFFILNGKNRNIKIADNGTPYFYVYYDNLHVCEICGGYLGNQGVICNDCGTICHKGESLFSSHSFYCKNCGKSICRNCANYFWKYFIIKTTVCNDCTKQEIKNGRKIKKYEPIIYMSDR